MSQKTNKDPPVVGHKCQGTRLYVAVHCDCGWSSGKWGAGAGGRSSAYGEWKWHIDQVHKGQAREAKPA